MHIGRRMDDGGNELVAISVWSDTEAMAAVVGNQFDSRSFLPALDAYLLESSMELYETVIDRFEDLVAAN